MTEETETKCRRCSECIGSEHHWLADPRPDIDEDTASDEEIADADYVWVCKHCPATKPYDPDDPEMYGDGYDEEGFDLERADAVDERQLSLMDIVERDDFGAGRFGREPS